jgi:uncharacterized protein YbjQ (UPF0145 family)
MEALVIWVLLITTGYVFGRRAEKKHYDSIAARERALLHLPTTSAESLLTATPPLVRVELALGSVVISVDYFKRIAAALRSLVGGRVQSYETLVDRARREAVLRLKESCPGADQIINLRIETSTVSGGGSRRAIGSVEVLAYGTALFFAHDAS